MATCESLQQILDKNLLPENPTTLLESLSWNQIKPVKSIEISSSPSSFTEIFTDLHSNFNHNEDSEACHDTSQIPYSSASITNHTTKFHKTNDSFSSLSSESLQLCTEGLGSESSDDVVEDSKSTGIGMNEYWRFDHMEKKLEGVKKKHHHSSSSYGECSRREYPPPISSIGRTGKPCVFFRSCRSNGRFVLKEIMIPKQEQLLRACREDGRLTLQFVQHDDEFLEDDDYDLESIDEEEEIIGKEIAQLQNAS